MEIKQKTYMEVEKNGKVVQLVCDADTPLGQVFDACMEFKAFCIDRMNKAHKDEQEHAEKMMEEEKPAEELEAESAQEAVEVEVEAENKE